MLPAMLLLNWRTTLAGVAVLGLGALKTFGGVDLSGFGINLPDLTTVVPIAAGLFAAKDGTN